MRKKQVPAHKQGDEHPVTRAPGENNAGRETEEGPEPGGRLEDDGFVFWPTTLGEPAGPRLVQVERKARPAQGRPRRRRRLSTTILFAVLFFAGAALTAAAGDEVATIVSPSSPPSATPTAGQDVTAPDVTAPDVTTDPTTTNLTTTDVTTTEATTTEPADTTTTVSGDPGQTEPTGSDGAGPGADTTPAGSQPSDGDGTTTPQPVAPSPTATTTTAPASTPAPAPTGGSGSGTPTPAPTAGSGSGADAGTSPAPSGRSAPQARSKPVPVLAPPPVASPSGRGHKHGKHGKEAKAAYDSQRQAPKPRDVEHEGTPGLGNGNVQWINQPLPDPTPPSMRLSPAFARELQATSSAQGLDWAFLLAVLRAERLDGSGEVATADLQKEAAALGTLHVDAGDLKTVLAYRQDDVFAQRVLVLERYYKAIGLNTLVDGLDASRDRLAAQVLSDPRIEIYPGGRDDISTGRVDVRVVAMIAFLAESFGDVRVSCLITGHRLYARPGVISAHIYGRAVDIAALDEIPIYEHQLQRGSITEQAIKQILLLPAEMMPKQVISLLGLGGPSFPLADHYDHIHIGY